MLNVNNAAVTPATSDDAIATGADGKKPSGFGAAAASLRFQRGRSSSGASALQTASGNSLTHAPHPHRISFKSTITSLFNGGKQKPSLTGTANLKAATSDCALGPTPPASSLSTPVDRSRDPSPSIPAARSTRCDPLPALPQQPPTLGYQQRHAEAAGLASPPQQQHHLHRQPRQDQYEHVDKGVQEEHYAHPPQQQQQQQYQQHQQRQQQREQHAEQRQVEHYTHPQQSQSNQQLSPQQQQHGPALHNRSHSEDNLMFSTAIPTRDLPPLPIAPEDEQAPPKPPRHVSRRSSSMQCSTGLSSPARSNSPPVGMPVAQQRQQKAKPTPRPRTSTAPRSPTAVSAAYVPLCSSLPTESPSPLAQASLPPMQPTGHHGDRAPSPGRRPPQPAPRKRRAASIDTPTAAWSSQQLVGSGGGSGEERSPASAPMLGLDSPVQSVSPCCSGPIIETHGGGQSTYTDVKITFRPKALPIKPLARQTSTTSAFVKSHDSGIQDDATAVVPRQESPSPPQPVLRR
eukprot:scpid64384/ scgid15454/ 